MNPTAPHLYGIASEYRQWPKCYRCSQELGYPYPVEHFGVVGRERPETFRGIYTLIIEVKCSHGEAERKRLEKRTSWKDYVRLPWNLGWGQRGIIAKYGEFKEQRIRVEIPQRWSPVVEDAGVRGSATELVALSRIYAFAPGAPGKLGVVYVPGDIARRHGLETNVR